MPTSDLILRFVPRYIPVTAHAYYSNTSPINPILNTPATSPGLRGYLFVLHAHSKLFKTRSRSAEQSYIPVISLAYYSTTSPINPILNIPATSPALRGYLFVLHAHGKLSKIRSRSAEQKVHSCHITRLLFNHQPNQPDPKHPRIFSRFAGVFICSTRSKQALQNAFPFCFAKVHSCHITRLLFNHQPNQPDSNAHAVPKKCMGIFTSPELLKYA